MSKYLIGVLTGLAGLAAGGWLIAAPFALGYQPENAGWVDATKVDFITGIVLVVIALATIIVFVLATRERLIELGALTRRVPQPLAAPAPAAAGPATQQPGGDLQALLAPLIAAMTADQQATAKNNTMPTVSSEKEPQP